MLAVNLSRVSEKYIKRLPPKQQRQITEKIFMLAENPKQPDARKLSGYEFYRRVDVGERRIIYRFSSVIVYITLVGKRNDDEVYRKFRRMM